MSRFNNHMNTHFGSCVLLAKAHDPYRNRDVQIRALPGEFDLVGVTDGTDAWVAPVVGDPFSVGVARLLEKLRAGTLQVVDTTARRRVEIPKDSVPAPRARRTIPAEALVDSPAPIVLRRR